MRIYISGPMTGLPGYNHDAFNAAAKGLRDAGHDVHNPAEVFAGDTTRTRERYMREAVKALLNSYAIWVLPGWQNSEGAKLEVAIAKELGLVFCRYTGAEGYAESVKLEYQDESLDDGACCGSCGDYVASACNGSESKSAQTGTESVLEEAQRIVGGDRSDAYGKPEDNFLTIARLWTTYLRDKNATTDWVDDEGDVHRDPVTVTPSDVALMMALLKIGRATTGKFKRDTAVDLAGYAACYARCNGEV